jgi:hypothetical protein
MTVIGLYLHMRVFIAYTLCMFKEPQSMKHKKREKINYERIREEVIKGGHKGLTEGDILSLRQMRSDYTSVANHLRSVNAR